MSIRKIVGLILMALGVIQYVYLLTDYAPPGRAVLPLFFIASLLFTAGGIIFRWDYWKRAKRNTRKI